MKSHSPIKIILTTLLVVAFGWGSMYLVTKGIDSINPSTVLVKTTAQKALTLEATVVNPDDQNDTATPVISASKNPKSSISAPSDKIQLTSVTPKTQSSASPNELTIMVGGDVTFDRGIRAVGQRNGYDSLFDSSITSLFKKADIVAVNLEGPITSNPSKTLVNGKTTDSFTFTSATEGALALAQAGVTIVSLANNHTDNFGFSGFTETQKWLSEAGIQWFGNPWNSTSSKMSTVELVDGNSPIATLVHKNGFTVAFVGYHSFQLGIDRVVAEIKRVSGPDVFTIVMPHWGEEYISTSSERMKSQARAFIAAGADAIIGAHPHVIMNQEWVGAVPIYYSVGNLLFDQYFSPEVMKGNLVELHLIKDSSGPHLDHVEVHDIHLKIGKGVVGE